MSFTHEEQQRLIELGDKIRKLRKARGRTLRDLAHSMGKDTQSIQRLEKGRVNPSFLYLQEVLTGLEATKEELRYIFASIYD